MNRTDRLNQIKDNINFMAAQLVTLRAQMADAGLDADAINLELRPLESMVDQHRRDLEKLELAAALLESMDEVEQ